MKTDWNHLLETQKMLEIYEKYGEHLEQLNEQKDYLTLLAQKIVKETNYAEYQKSWEQENQNA